MRLKFFLPYLLLFVVSCLVFLSVLLPKAQTADKISRMLSLPAAGLNVRVGSVAPGFFPGFHCLETQIQYQASANITPAAMKVFLPPELLLGKMNRLGFSATIGAGSIEGKIFRTPDAALDIQNLILDFKQILLQKVAYQVPGSDIQIDARMSGSFQYLPLKEKSESGNGEILLEKAVVQIKNVFFTRIKLEKLPFTQIEIHFSQARNLINIKSIEAKGPVINLLMKGALTLKQPFSESRLVLSGTILPDSPYLANFANSAYIRARVQNIKTQGLAFQVEGTFKQPEIKL